MLLQVLNDEFEVNVEDDSAEEVAARIVGLRKLTLQGDFEEVDRMYERWLDRQRRGGGEPRIQKVERGDDDDDTDSESDDREDADEGEDTQMDEAPALVKQSRDREQPQIDEDGFMKVISKKKR